MGGKLKRRISRTKRERTQYLEGMWREQVKANCDYKCVVCGMALRGPKTPNAPVGDCHHIAARKSNALHYDVKNGVYLCKGHHRFWVHSPDTIRAHWTTEKVREYIGEAQWLYLVQLRADTRKRSLAEIEAELMKNSA